MLENLLNDILKEENVLVSINVGGAIIEMRVNKDLQYRTRKNWITVGDNDGPCHMHINKNEVKEIRFVREKKETKTSYSIRLMNANDERLIAVFFTRMQDENGNPVKERIERYECIFKKYGSKEVIPLHN